MHSIPLLSPPPPSLIPDIPDDVLIVRVFASLSNASRDGFYQFENSSFAMLDPPNPDFYESFNAINWTISLSERGEVRNIIFTIQKNPLVCSLVGLSNCSYVHSVL